MTLSDIFAATLIAFMGCIVLGLLLVLLRGAHVTSRPMRALRRRLLGRAWQPLLMEPVELHSSDTRPARKRSPATATPLPRSTAVPAGPC